MINKKKYIARLFFLFLFLLIFFSSPHNSSDNPIKHIVIFIHGTIISRKEIPSLFIHAFNQEKWIGKWKTLEEKRWHREVKTLRAIYGNTPGLELINITSLAPQVYKNIFLPFKKAFEEKIEKNTLYYSFNWNGSLLETARREAASILAESIILLKKNYPHAVITIICHSHGGNVALEAGTFLQSTNSIQIDTLILLGTPISKKTEAWVTTKNKACQLIFKNILNVFSKWDWLQPLDIFFNNFRPCKKSFSSTLGNVKNIPAHTESHWSFYYYSPKHEKEFISLIPEKLKADILTVC